MSREFACEVALCDLKSEPVKRFDAYWRSKWHGDALPRRLDIDPSEILDLLPLFILADIEAQPFRVRFRLCGTRVSLLDEELTGRYLDDLKNTSADEKQRIQTMYERVCLDRQPLYMRASNPSQQTGNLLRLEGAIWPLSSDGGRVDKCAAIEDFPDLG
ncbi:PAS domain-containing protein [Hypericibacter sp.]|uniref:PAS domain-containing protein n=1 Tax=Hypericibacter sp. TaxID=2705401 RepID=UPI003D6D99A1